MSELADRYERVAAGFTARVDAVPDAAWESPAPCEGWVARDVVRHLVQWVPGFFATYAGLELATAGDVPDDAAAAWRSLDDAIRAALADRATASRTFEMRGQRYTVEQAIDTFVTGDVLVHTWDLARAAGLDETLDADEVHRLYEGLMSFDEAVLRSSGQYGPRVDVPDTADEQTKLLAYTGRHP
jgi:uncharacterized protein (TIGR03086 family)